MGTTKTCLATLVLLAIVLLATLGPGPTDDAGGSAGPESSSEVLSELHAANGR